MIEDEDAKFVRGLDGALVPDKLARMKCGGVPVFDRGSMCSYRCDACGATIGSMSQPTHCIELNGG